MLTKDEKSFMEYWEKNREKEKNFFRQLTYGSPRGLVFALPVLIAVIFHDWYKNMIMISTSQLVVIMVTVIAIALFYSIFRMKFKWENNEQLYKELKFKEKKNNAAVL
jgi:ABC-type maltose transport system permease subunit